ncbi:hypothetical protein GCM10008915_16130 [Bifidobacterium pullorum subsp. gallinarum]
MSVNNKKTSTEVEVNVQKKSMKKERGQEKVKSVTMTNYSGCVPLPGSQILLVTQRTNKLYYSS